MSSQTGDNSNTQLFSVSDVLKMQVDALIKEFLFHHQKKVLCLRFLDQPSHCIQGKTLTITEVIIRIVCSYKEENDCRLQHLTNITISWGEKTYLNVSWSKKRPISYMHHYSIHHEKICEHLMDFLEEKALLNFMTEACVLKGTEEPIRLEIPSLLTLLASKQLPAEVPELSYRQAQNITLPPPQKKHHHSSKKKARVRLYGTA